MEHNKHVVLVLSGRHTLFGRGNKQRLCSCLHTQKRDDLAPRKNKRACSCPEPSPCCQVPARANRNNNKRVRARHLVPARLNGRCLCVLGLPRATEKTTNWSCLHDRHQTAVRVQEASAWCLHTRNRATLRYHIVLGAPHARHTHNGSCPGA
nr:MAG: hypothetical protein [Molluscum contagiosum virus]WQH58169.1 MAG: hypothetical protein [Molluscum contagiosum virus]